MPLEEYTVHMTMCAIHLIMMVQEDDVNGDDDDAAAPLVAGLILNL